MHQPARPDALRRLCGLVLLAWLLTLISGTAHAWLQADPGAPASPWHALHEGAVAHLHDDHGGSEAHGGHVHASDPGHADDHASCHKFCQDERLALGKSGHEHVDFTPALVPWGGPLPPATPAIPRLASSPWERPTAHGPPLVIRFLKLTL